MKDRAALLAQFTQLLPLAAQWAAGEEARVLREGIPLSPAQMDDACALGILEPERIRLLRVEEIPLPPDPTLRAAAETVHFLSPETRGLTLQYGILVRWDCWGDRSLLAHELAHTAQYESLGGILPFLREYLTQCLTIGYANAPMELEAAAAAARICPA
jgi:hypothetical protein